MRLDIRFHLLLGLLLVLNISCQNSKSLFLENEENWIEEGTANWKFLSNEFRGIVTNDEVGFVITKQTYKDFVLELEFKPDSTINSGVFIRCKNYELSADSCYEINIWDLHSNQDFRTGAVVKMMKPLAIVETIGKWNSYKIKMEDDHLEVWINGVLTSNLIDDSLLEGYIGLQASGTGEIRFRNVRISMLE